VDTTTFEVRTGDREVVADITRRCRRFVEDAGGDGLLHEVPRLTAATVHADVLGHTHELTAHHGVARPDRRG
jgi:hypothetical protein